MTNDSQGTPIEEEGGYGTPTVEQETGGADTKKFAQPREEEAFDAAGLSQDSPDGETYPAGAPDLSQFGAEDQDSAGEPGAGRFGGTEDQLKAENESTDPGFEDSARNRCGRRGSALRGGGNGRVQHRGPGCGASVLLGTQPGRGRNPGRQRH